MSLTAALSAPAALRLLVAVAVGALCTAGASAGAATMLTGSPSPSVWASTYERTAACSRPGSVRDPRCSVAAAQAAAEQRLADSLESKAKALAAQQGSSGATAQQATSPAAPAPAFAAPHAGDDASAGHDD